MKNIKKISVILLVIFALFTLSSCFDDDSSSGSSSGSDSYSSGDRFDLSSDKVKCKSDYDTSVKKTYYSITLDSSCEGYSSYSYFDCVVFISCNYKGLDDKGDYVDANIERSYKLDNNGNGELDDVDISTSYRDIKDVKISVSFRGFVVYK